MRVGSAKRTRADGHTLDADRNFDNRLDDRRAGVRHRAIVAANEKHVYMERGTGIA